MSRISLPAIILLHFEHFVFLMVNVLVNAEVVSVNRTHESLILELLSLSASFKHCRLLNLCGENKAATASFYLGPTKK